MNALPQDAAFLTAASRTLHRQNETFRNVLLKQSATDLDHLFSNASRQIALQIDCLQCARCCKGLQAELSGTEYDRLRAKAPETAFAHTVEHDGSEARHFLNQPCYFLSETRCRIYSDRPNACSGYPHLDVPGIRYRLRTVFSQVSVCPIVFHTLELLKQQTGFNNTAS